jgi:uncharacterized UBP type Zn finger protein
MYTIYVYVYVLLEYEWKQPNNHAHAVCLFFELFPIPSVACQEHRTAESARRRTAKTTDVCLACELDKLMLRYFASARGVDVLSAVTDDTQESAVVQGEPLIASDMLTSAWKCGGMNHLAGYDQRDAHEFLHGFLDSLNKSDCDYRKRIARAVSFAQQPKVPGGESKTPSYRGKWQSNRSFGRSVVPYIAVVCGCLLACLLASTDCSFFMRAGIVKTLFEGTFRSVLICQQCGNKRAQSESFTSISLPLSKEVHRATTTTGKSGMKKLSVERCLRHFTMPETLADPVDCPSCGKKTLTKKQHVISKLPRVLVLHLKRFDAAQNKKIEDFVSFPEKALNMGPYLPHWYVRMDGCVCRLP